MGSQVDVHGAAELDLEAGNAQGLRELLNSPVGDTISRYCTPLPLTAAHRGDMQCLRVLEEVGFVLCSRVWACAARNGRVNCLDFAVSHGYTFEDGVLVEAVLYGQLGSVDFLLHQGLPCEPFVHSVFRTSPGQLECLQLMLDRGVAINPKTLILAASHGDVDFVRWLHQRGVPLWRDARDARTKTLEWVYGCPLTSGSPAIYQFINQWETVEHQKEPPGTIVIPWDSIQREGAPTGLPASTWDPCDLEGTWKALRYGTVFGAPVTQTVEQLFAKKRERTHTVLLCFKSRRAATQGAWACEAEARVGCHGRAAIIPH